MNAVTPSLWGLHPGDLQRFLEIIPWSDLDSGFKDAKEVRSVLQALGPAIISLGRGNPVTYPACYSIMSHALLSQVTVSPGLGMMIRELNTQKVTTITDPYD